MLRASLRRSSHLRLARVALLVLFVALFLDFLSLITTFRKSSAVKPVPNVQDHRVFITSIHWNNEKILRSSWNAAVLNLVQYFGRTNVFVSIYESGSWDDTKGALRQLDDELDRLQVPKRVILDETTHEQQLQRGPEPEGWIEKKDGKKELRRIPYLARLRNLALQPLLDLDKEDTRFDKILFLNDVAFTVWSFTCPPPHLQFH